MSENGAPRDTQSETKIRKSVQEAHIGRIKKELHFSFIFDNLWVLPPAGPNRSIGPFCPRARILRIDLAWFGPLSNLSAFESYSIQEL